jgi:hypothetical protein
MRSAVQRIQVCGCPRWRHGLLSRGPFSRGALWRTGPRLIRGFRRAPGSIGRADRQSHQGNLYARLGLAELFRRYGEQQCPPRIIRDPPTAFLVPVLADDALGRFLGSLPQAASVVLGSCASNSAMARAAAWSARSPHWPRSRSYRYILRNSSSTASRSLRRRNGPSVTSRAAFTIALVISGSGWAPGLPVGSGPLPKR